MDWSQIRTWLSEQWSRIGEHSREWLVVTAVFLVALFAMRLLLAIAKRRIKAWSQQTATDWNAALVAMLDATRGWFLVVASAYVALLIPPLRDDIAHFVRSAAVLALLVQAALWGQTLLEFKLQRYVSQRLETDPASATTVSMLSFIGKLILWTVVLLLALENATVDVTALIGGLGIGGIAVALASQNILSDLFSALSIALDKPFVLGDNIVVGDAMGTVEKIGLKTTRVRSLSGEQLIFSNADLLQSRIRNFKRMYERRVLLAIGVTYQTPADTLESIPGMIRDIVAAQDDVRFDRSHFKEYGDSALNFETVYYVLSSDYKRYMDIQQRVNLAVCRKFAQEGIGFAYPTRTIFLENANTQNSKAA